MAAVFFNALADPDRARAVSAGTEPAARVHPEVVDVMREVGVELTRATPQGLTDALVRDARLLVTMGCGESCPLVPGVERADWDLADPKGQPLERVRQIRDDIRDRVAALVRAREWQRGAS